MRGAWRVRRGRDEQDREHRREQGNRRAPHGGRCYRRHGARRPASRRPGRPVVSAAFRGAAIPHDQPGLAVPAGPLHPDRDRARGGARGRGGDVLRLGARRHPDRRADGPRHRGARRALRARDRRPAQRHLRQRARADHRPLRARRRAARGGQGLDRRLDHGQHPARARGRDVLRRPQARPPALQPHGRLGAVLDAAAGRRRAGHAGHLRAGRRARAAAAGRRARALRHHRPGALGRGGVRADPLLRGRAVVLAEDPSRPLQPREPTIRTTASRGRCASRSSRWASRASRWA